MAQRDVNQPLFHNARAVWQRNCIAKLNQNIVVVEFVLIQKVPKKIKMILRTIIFAKERMHIPDRKRMRQADSGMPGSPMRIM